MIQQLTPAYQFLRCPGKRRCHRSIPEIWMPQYHEYSWIVLLFV